MPANVGKRFRVAREVLVGIVWIAAITPSARALDSVALGVGKSDGAYLLRIAAQQYWHRAWVVNDFAVSAFWDYGLGYWRAEKLNGGRCRGCDGGFQTHHFRSLA
jgi:hypothetical protein